MPPSPDINLPTCTDDHYRPPCRSFTPRRSPIIGGEDQAVAPVSAVVALNLGLSSGGWATQLGVLTWRFGDHGQDDGRGVPDKRSIGTGALRGRIRHDGAMTTLAARISNQAIGRRHPHRLQMAVTILR